MRAYGPRERLEAAVRGRGPGEVLQHARCDREGRADARGVASAPRDGAVVRLGDAVDHVGLEPCFFHRHALAAVQQAHPVPVPATVGALLCLRVPAGGCMWVINSFKTGGHVNLESYPVYPGSNPGWKPGWKPGSVRVVFGVECGVTRESKRERERWLEIDWSRDMTRCP